MCLFLHRATYSPGWTTGSWVGLKPWPRWTCRSIRRATATLTRKCPRNWSTMWCIITEWEHHHRGRYKWVLVLVLVIDLHWHFDGREKIDSRSSFFLNVRRHGRTNPGNNNWDGVAFGGRAAGEFDGFGLISNREIIDTWPGAGAGRKSAHIVGTCQHSARQVDCITICCK